MIGLHCPLAHARSSEYVPLPILEAPSGIRTPTTSHLALCGGTALNRLPSTVPNTEKLTTAKADFTRT